ncbi:MAG TPA: zf-HC2 domain-containing protein [Pirellulales bacterium]|jgi:hypothetical protein|nr:zf-HC2 domain-containing protein [Pirellulales bacterium]
MNCDVFERRLDEVLDDRLPPESDAALIAHAEHCPSCARSLADHQGLLEAMQLLAWPSECEKLGTRVLAEVVKERGKAWSDPRSEPRAKPQANGSPAVPASTPTLQPFGGGSGRPAQRSLLHTATWIAVATAASLLVSIGTVHWSRSRQAARLAPPKPAETNSSAIAAAMPGPKPGALAIHMPGMHAAAADQSFAGLIGPQQRILMEQMSDGLKPVTRSMSAALHALRRTLPGSEAPARSS